MTFLRTASTRRLLGTIAGVLLAVAMGTAIAVAASGSGPVPPRKGLAPAIHAALGAPAVPGISARVSFSNHLIDSSDLQGSDPILSGATGRLWLSADHQFRLELQSDNGDAQVVVNQRTFWVYDPSAHTVYEGKLPAQNAHKQAVRKEGLPSLKEIQSDLARLTTHLNVSGAVPGDIAHQPTYTVRVSPKHDGGLLGAAELGWDANHGVPLRFAVYASNDSSPVLELKATQISYQAIKASVFNVAPPHDAKVVRIATPSGSAAADSARRHHARRHQADVQGAAAVAKRVPFTLIAPGKLVGLPQQTAMLLSSGGQPGAVITYGQNLGGVAVIEQRATTGTASGAASQGGGRERRGLNLPTVSINGVTGQELDTALGTVIRFTRAGVAYTVVGSVPPSAAEAAARAL